VTPVSAKSIFLEEVLVRKLTDVLMTKDSIVSLPNEPQIIHGDPPFADGELGVGVAANSNVYILVHRTANLLKIGKANNIIDRAFSLGLEDFELERSIGLQVNSAIQAFELERMLHLAFKEHRLSIFEASKSVNHDSGLTEWFNADCLGRVHAFLEHIGDLIQFRQVAVDISDLTPKGNAARYLGFQKKLQQSMNEVADDAEQLNAASAIERQIAMTGILDLCKFTGLHSKGSDSFDVFFGPNCSWTDVRDSKEFLKSLVTHGSFRHQAGFTPVLAGSFLSKDGGYIEILRPLLSSTDGNHGPEIETYFEELLTFFRALPMQSNLSFYDKEGEFFNAPT
jgi:hypothetical protein